MPRFIVESFAAGSAIDSQQQRAELAAKLGTDVHYVRTTFLPGDETAFHMFDATSIEALRRAAQAAAMTYDRITEAVEASAGGTDVEKGRER